MASSPLDVIKQYLVSLGFEVDKSSYDTATKAIDSAGESLAKLAGTTVKQFGLATAAVASFVTTAVVGMAKFLNDLGNAQIQYEMLSRQMWTTQQNAEAFSTTLKAMGRSLNDLYLSPTLMAQFQSLNRQAFEMMPPSEYQQQMKFIQSISFEFTRMKLEGTYALQWIGYYFIKYMAGPLANIQMTLHGLNDTIIKQMPYWTKVVAEVMSWFGQFGVTSVEAIKDVAKVFSDVGQMIPTNIKLIGLAILGLAAIINTGPIGMISAAIIGLGLAVNDFFTYIHGGQAEFGAFWQKLIDLYNKLKDSGAIDNFKNGLKTAFQDASTAVIDTKNKIVELYKTMDDNGTISDIKKSFENFFGILSKLTKDQTDLFKDMFKALDQSGVLNDLGNDFLGIAQAVSQLTKAVTGLFNTFLALKGTKKVFTDIEDWISAGVLSKLREVDLYIKGLISGMKALADLLQGKWGKSWDDLKSFFTGSNSSPSNKSYLYPSSSNKTTNNNQKTSMNITQNIYGSSDPTATANAASNNITTAMRNQRGVIA